MILQDSHTRLIQLITDLKEQQVAREVVRLLEKGDSPLEILRSCEEAMRQVGQHYEQRLYFVSGLIMAGEIMRQVTDLLLPHIENQESGGASGLIVLGTVEGDIHDIGKNLLRMLLRGSGLQVLDLGVDVPPTQFVEVVLQHKPDIIGLSALLTIAYEAMRDTISLIHAETAKDARRIPTIIGGGFMNEKVCQFVGSDYWAPDAVTGIEICRRLVAPDGFADLASQF